MEFYDFQKQLEMSSSQLTFTPSIFRGLGQPPTRHAMKLMFSRFMCFTCVTRKMGRWASTGSTMVGIRIGPIRRHKDHTTEIWLVVWNIIFHILGIIIPTDFFIFFRGVETSNPGCLLPSGKATYCGWASKMLHHQKDD